MQQKAPASRKQREEFHNTRFGSYGTDSGLVDRPYALISNNMLGYVMKPYKLAVGAVNGINLDYTNVTSASKVLPDTAYKCMDGQTAKAAAVENIMGIRADTGAMELAQDFLKTAMSADILSANDHALPVNEVALDKVCSNDWVVPDESFGMMSLTDDAGNETSYELYWPDEKQIADLKKMIHEAETPYVSGGWIEEAVIAAGMDVLKGMATVDEGMDRVRRDVKLYMAE